MLINLFNLNINILEIPVGLIIASIVFSEFCLKGTKLFLKDKSTFNTNIVLMILMITAILLSSLTAISLKMVLKSFFKWIEIFSISILVFLYITTVKRFKQIYWLIFISTFLSIIFVIIEISRGNILFFEERVLPGYDSFFAFSLLIPFALFSKNKKIVISTSLVLLLSAILSMSRGVWLGIVIFVFYYLYVNNNKSILKLLGVAIPGIFIVVFAYEPFREFIFYRIDEMFYAENVSNIERISMMKYALVGFSHSPIWGIGALNFPLFLAREGFTRGIVSEDLAVLEPHNLFLQTLTEEGIIGFIVIALFFLNIYIMLYRNSSIFNSDTKAINPYIFGLRLMYIAVLINISFGFIANQFRFNFALFIGLSLSLSRLKLNKMQV